MLQEPAIVKPKAKTERRRRSQRMIAQPPGCLIFQRHPGVLFCFAVSFFLYSVAALISFQLLLSWQRPLWQAFPRWSDDKGEPAGTAAACCQHTYETPAYGRNCGYAVPHIEFRLQFRLCQARLTEDQGSGEETGLSDDVHQFRHPVHIGLGEIL